MVRQHSKISAGGADALSVGRLLLYARPSRPPPRRGTWYGQVGQRSQTKHQVPQHQRLQRKLHLDRECTLQHRQPRAYGTYEYLSKILGKETERTKSQSIGKGSRGSSSDSLQTAGRELCMPDEIRRMRDDECLLLMRSEDPVIDKKYNLLHHPNVKYTPDAGGEPYVMPPDYMGDAATITMDAVAAATAPEITEEMYEQLDYLEKHPEENYYENEENFSQYDQGD